MRTLLAWKLHQRFYAFSVVVGELQHERTPLTKSCYIQIQLKSLAEEMQAIVKGLEKVELELNASEKDGPVSEIFRKVWHPSNHHRLIFLVMLYILQNCS